MTCPIQNTLHEIQHNLALALVAASANVLRGHHVCARRGELWEKSEGVKYTSQMQLGDTVQTTGGEHSRLQHSFAEGKDSHHDRSVIA